MAWVLMKVIIIVIKKINIRHTNAELSSTYKRDHLKIAWPHRSQKKSKFTYCSILYSTINFTMKSIKTCVLVTDTALYREARKPPTDL